MINKFFLFYKVYIVIFLFFISINVLATNLNLSSKTKILGFQPCAIKKTTGPYGIKRINKDELFILDIKNLVKTNVQSSDQALNKINTRLINGSNFSCYFKFNITILYAELLDEGKHTNEQINLYKKARTYQKIDQSLLENIDKRINELVKLQEQDESILELNANSESVVKEELKDLKEIYEMGLITKEVYQERVAELLRNF